jgi:hypothetical protein
MYSARYIQYSAYSDDQSTGRAHNIHGERKYEMKNTHKITVGDKQKRQLQLRPSSNQSGLRDYSGTRQ